MLNLRK